MAQRWQWFDRHVACSGVAVALTLVAGVATADTDARALDAFVEAARGADVVFLGEVHDNADAHAVQAEMIARIAPKGVAWEMIPTARETAVAMHLADGGAIPALAEVLDWANSGWPEWALYEPLFVAAGPAVLHTGAALPRATVRAMVGDPDVPLDLDPGIASRLARPLSASVQAEMEAEMVDAHCGHLPASMAPGMVRVQRARDAALASAAVRALQHGGPVVVIAGNGHVRNDRGAPTYLTETLSVVSLVIAEREPGTDEAPGDMPATHVWYVPPAERPDPCAAFTKG